jgi:N-acetylmuramic acid 6-phosphate etherase
MFRDTGLMPSEKPRVLGIEGGGTKTEWVVLEGDSVVQQGLLPQSNLRLNTDEQLTQLFNVMPRDVSHVGAFLAACGTPDDRARLQRLVSGSWPKALVAVGSDRDSALATAFHDGDGLIVIAGTGAAVHGRRGGRIEKAGGWGHVVGDRGGGYDLARQALRLVLTRFDLEQHVPAFAERILQQLALNSLSDLAAWAMEADKMSVARLAPSVFEAVHRGEPEMLEVAQGGASVLAEFTKVVARRLEWADPPVRLFGGVFTQHKDYASLFTHRLSILLPGANVEVCHDSGALGAAWLAARVVPKQTTEPKRPVDLNEIAVAATEQSNPRSENLDTLATADLVQLFVNEERYVEEALRAEQAGLVRAVDLVSDAMAQGGRLFYAGAGTSGRLGVLDASEIPAAQLRCTGRSRGLRISPNMAR